MLIHAMSEMPPRVRSMAQALDDLVEKLDSLPERHPDRERLRRQIETLEDFIGG